MESFSGEPTQPSSPPTLMRAYHLLSLLAAMAIPRAATVTIPVTADTTLHEVTPASNLGATTHVAAGAVGTRAGSLPTRGLFRFDLTGKIPAGATVTSAKFIVSVVFSPGGPASVFELHRVLRAWGEGNKSGNLGEPASPGEATWRSPDGSNTLWEGASNDIITPPSSEAFVNAAARYTFDSTPNMISDVQGWLSNPSSNFGWLLKTSTENISQTARRFGAKEGGSSTRAALEVTFAEAPAEIRIVEFRLEQSGMFMRWTGGAPPFRIERTSIINGGWELLGGPISESQTTASVGDSISFYRVVSGIP